MKLTVDPPEMHRASEKFQQISEQYTTVYTRLINAASTMGDAWKAADNLAFVEQINGFCEELKDMADHLALAAEVLRQQASNYESTRDGNVTSVRTLKN